MEPVEEMSEEERSEEEMLAEDTATSARSAKVKPAGSDPEADEVTQAFGLLQEVQEFVEGDDFGEATELEVETQLDMLELAFKEMVRLKQSVGVAKMFMGLKNRLKERTNLSNQATVQPARCR